MLQPGTLLCLFTIPFGVINSFHHAVARRPHPRRYLAHLVNLLLAVGFAVLGFAGTDLAWGDAPALRLAQLWLPIVYFWWAYAWAGWTLHLFHPPDFSYDRPLIRLEQRWFGNPSVWLARGRPRWLNETMNFFYWSYYLYTPVLGAALYLAGDYRSFAAMALAVNLGYAVSYSLYPWFPLWGPRWALVDEGLVDDGEKILDGYLVTAFMNRIMWSDTAHKGGAMPSAHSATCIVFMIWCVRLWGLEGTLIGGVIGGGMFVSTVYGRYHYVIDVLVGGAIGLGAVYVADALTRL